MPDEIDRLNETAEDRGADFDFGAGAFASRQLPPPVAEILQSAAAKIGLRQAEAHALALRSGKGVLGRLTQAPGRVGATFEVTDAVEVGVIAWAPSPGLGFGGWPQ